MAAALPMIGMAISAIGAIAPMLSGGGDSTPPQAPAPVPPPAPPPEPELKATVEPEAVLDESAARQRAQRRRAGQTQTTLLSLGQEQKQSGPSLLGE